jgi:glyoxylase-like metal-dependent hydrolase (beta-lactamase superfamily II)
MIRSVQARNASAMTLDGTRTYLVGENAVAVIDPGPDISSHIEAIAEAVPRPIAILLTHAHPDHAAGAASLAARTGAPVRCMADGSLADGDVIVTDNGPLITVHSPGHTPDHAGFHWPDRETVFCGDLMMGGLDTALVAPPEGDLSDYLRSLERIRLLRPVVIIPSHGPPFTAADEAITRYVEHRQIRLRQVLDALRTGPLTTGGVAESVYGGTIPADLRGVATGAAEAYLRHLANEELVIRDDGHWQLVDRAH